jgi:peptidase E
MAALQEFCFRSVTNLALLNKEKKKEYFEAMRKLLEKQKIFYLRIQLSDDPEAKSVAENMKNAVVMLGGNPDLNVLDMFDDLLQKINQFEEHVDKNP